jgi:hypothetical protein
MTPAELAAFTGRTGVLRGCTLPIPVTVIEAKLAYGVLRFVVCSTIEGFEATVNSDRVTLTAQGAPNGG